VETAHVQVSDHGSLAAPLSVVGKPLIVRNLKRVAAVDIGR
jgi:hypothetical protein